MSLVAVYSLLIAFYTSSALQLPNNYDVTNNSVAANVTYCMHDWWLVEETGEHVDVDAAVGQIVLSDIERWFGATNGATNDTEGEEGHPMYDMHFEYQIINVSSPTSAIHQFYVATANIVVFDHEVGSLNFTDLYHDVEVDWHSAFPSSLIHYSRDTFSIYNGSCHPLLLSLFDFNTGIDTDTGTETDTFAKLLREILIPVVSCFVFGAAAFLVWFVAMRLRSARVSPSQSQPPPGLPRSSFSSVIVEMAEALDVDLTVPAASTETPRPPPRLVMQEMAQKALSPVPASSAWALAVPRHPRSFANPAAMDEQKSEHGSISCIVDTAPQLAPSPAPTEYLSPIQTATRSRCLSDGDATANSRRDSVSLDVEHEHTQTSVTATMTDSSALYDKVPWTQQEIGETGEPDSDGENDTNNDGYKQTKLADATSINTDATEALQALQQHEVRRWFDTKLKVLLTSARHTYYTSFVENGFDNMAVIKTMTDEDLFDIGITKLGHRKQILSEIQQL